MAQNLERTWKPQTKIDANSSYAMGWVSERANGMNVLTHNGKIDSFETHATMLPDSGVGIVLFTNSSSGPYFYRAVSNWVLQEIAGLPETALEKEARGYDEQKPDVKLLRDSAFSFKADCSAVGPFVGTYQKGWTVEYDPDNTLWLTRGDQYRAQLLQTARGYLVGTSEYQGAAWYVKFDQADKARHLRITAFSPDGSQTALVDLVTQTEAQPVSC